MPLISYDSRSFSIDGRRVWLVSGSIHYATTPRGQWRHRLRAAREAGLNCIETPVVWSVHEEQPKQFDFEGDLDLRAFVKLAAEEGLYCILRPGPFVGEPYDFGGLPAYLHGVTGKKDTRVKFRESEPLFLESVARYCRALMEQIGDLQVASPGASSSSSYDYAPGSAAGGYQGEGGGPIIMMQVEHAWESQIPEDLYLTRLVSMLRQYGCLVPLTNANNLWQPIEGTIDTWRGDVALPAMMRQLNSVHPEVPTIVSHFETTEQANWGDELAESIEADTLTYRIAGLLGIGVQFNLSPFAAGASSGFSTGKRALASAAPLDESGRRGDRYQAVKRVCTFASQFAPVLANSESQPAPTVALNESDHSAAILHQRSSQGELIMLLKSAKDKSRHTEIMLSNGLTLDLPHAGQRAAWALLNTSLGGRNTLDYTSLSPWAFINHKLLVVFGPANATGHISIDGQHHTVTVPTGKNPLVIEGDPIHVAVLNGEQIDAAYRTAEGLVIGCDGTDDEGKPQPLAGWGTQFTIATSGKVGRKRINPTTTPAAPRLTNWRAYSVKSLVDGSDPSYRPIDGPASLGELGQAFGYGWYRFNKVKPVAGKVLPHIGGDRLHLYQANKLAALLGTGEGAEQGAKQLKLTGDTIVLADALGRTNRGQGIGADPKGMPDHLYAVKPIKPGKPTITKQAAGDPFTATGYAHHQRVGARPIAEAVEWTIKPDDRKPIILEIDALGQSCVVSINDAPTHYYATDESHPSDGPTRLLFDPAAIEAMTGGKNSIKLHLLEPLADGVKIDKHVRFYQTERSVTPSDGWAFAPWTIPAIDDEAWRDVPKTLPSQPSWLCGSFTIESLDAPLYLEPHGMSKGQIFLNGHNVTRYWQQTREGKIVGPKQRYLLPDAWLNLDQPNTLMLFDEHGRTPDKCSLVYIT